MKIEKIKIPAYGHVIYVVLGDGYVDELTQCLSKIVNTEVLKEVATMYNSYEYIGCQHEGVCYSVDDETTIITLPFDQISNLNYLTECFGAIADLAIFATFNVAKGVNLKCTEDSEEAIACLNKYVFKKITELIDLNKL